MLRNLKKGALVLTLSLMTLSVTGCETINNLTLLLSDGEDTTEYPYDICTAEVEVFWLSDEEIDMLSSEALQNITQINCTLYDECGFEIPNPESCPQL
jgi:hypothetical protein